MTERSEQFLADGLVQILKPIVEECDTRIQEVFTSQSELSLQIDLLSQELEKFMAVSKTPSLQPYVQKLNVSRSRMDHINRVLAQINARLDHIQQEVKNNS